MATEIKNTKAFYNTEIPGNWDVKSLGDVVTFINGKAYNQEELLSEGKYKVLRVGNFFTKGEWYFSDLELEDDKYVNDGDLMYAWSASFGPQFWKGEKTIYHYHIWKVIPSELITKQFLFFLLDYDMQRILSSKQGGTMFHITKGDMEKRKSIIPPLPEQRAIARVLSTADAAINATEKLIAQKELRKKWLIQQLLTGKKRLNGFVGEWRLIEISKLFKTVNRYVEWNENELYKLISIRRRNGGAFFRDALFGYQIGVKKLKVVIENDFVISKRQVSHGAWAIIDPLFSESKVSDEYNCLVINDKASLSPEFWKWCCQLPILTHFANIDSDGVHIEKSIFDYNLFKRRKVVIPCTIEEQTAIAQVLQAADKEVNLLKAKAEKLREQKKWLMQVLLTGIKRLKIN